jgi:DNA processing protein
MPIRTTSEHVEDWLWLSLLPGVGDVRALRMVDAFGTAGAVRGATVPELERVLGNSARSLANVVRTVDLSVPIKVALDWIAEPNNHLIPIDAPEYPSLLKEIADPPLVLYGGAETATRFAQALSASGLTVVSGLALGIDAAAHRGALDNAGSTIAVVGTGLDRVYPARNAALAHEVAEKGLLLSELPLSTPPLAENFPRRNRIISGLSLGVLVVEAAIASGSLITARFAADYGRDVFAIPGSIHSPLSRGSHGLIKQGAKLVEDAADILRELGWLGMTFDRVATEAVEPTESACNAQLTAEIGKVMGFDPVSIDELAERTGEDISTLMGELSLWEIEGLLTQLPGGRFQRLR